MIRPDTRHMTIYGACALYSG